MYAAEDAATDTPADAPPATRTYRCLMCGAVFEVPEGETPVCPVCGFVYVPEELALGKVLSVERALEDK